MNLILIGYRGTGKTTVAPCLAGRLGWPWLDSDAAIEQAAGCTIVEIFWRRGEAAFRDRESAVLGDLVQRDRQVLAVGGGAILRPENRQLLAAAGRIVWLRATPETIWRRLSADPATPAQRPNLTPAGGLPEIRQQLGLREPLYQQCAALEVDTENKDPDAIADEILRRLDLEA